MPFRCLSLSFMTWRSPYVDFLHKLNKLCLILLALTDLLRQLKYCVNIERKTEQRQLISPTACDFLQRHMVQLILWILKFVQTSRYALELRMRHSLGELMLELFLYPITSNNKMRYTCNSRFLFLPTWCQFERLTGTFLLFIEKSCLIARLSISTNENQHIPC